MIHLDSNQQSIQFFFKILEPFMQVADNVIVKVTHFQSKMLQFERFFSLVLR